MRRAGHRRELGEPCSRPHDTPLAPGQRGILQAVDSTPIGSRIEGVGREAEEIGRVALLHEPTRRLLYEYVRSRGRPVGRDEAAGAAGVSRSLAAFHLDRLAEAGLL